MKTTIRKAISLLLCLVLCLSLLPQAVLAEETGNAPEEPSPAGLEEMNEDPLEEENAPVPEEEVSPELEENVSPAPKEINQEPSQSPVSYLNAKGETCSCEAYAVIDSNNMPTDWSAGWYVVQGTADYTEGGTQTNGITYSGEVHLILSDGCALSVKGEDGKAGICVGGDGNSLTIYGQSGGTGKLDASSAYLGAGIGGGYNGGGSNITINGGTVNATGADGGAGIGGGYGRAGKNITINGGTVTATGGNDGGAGIGGGSGGNGISITINGGTVTATGIDYAAGIGGGKSSSGTDITITGGKVFAQGGNVPGPPTAYGAAGIGGGVNAAGSNITISGGEVTAKGGSGGGAGIGGGSAGKGSGSNITISGGTVNAEGGNNGAGIGGGTFGAADNITISGGTVNAKGGVYGAGIGSGTGKSASNITITGGTVTATGGREAAGIGGGAFTDGRDISITGGFINASGSSGGEDIGSGKDGAAASGISLSGGCYAREPKAEYVPACCKLTENPDSNTKTDYSYMIQLSTVAYLDASQNEQTLKELYTIIDSTNMPTTWTEGWYVVQGTADYTEGGTQTNGITCSGAVHLILTDGCNLTVKGADGKAGICVSGDGNSLTIYGQSGGTGKLDTTGGGLGAGIGGGEKQSGNNIAINGGTVTVAGGLHGAGIGGGNNGFGINITINGGIVTAKGGDGAAGIGGGFSWRGSNITINGGTVKAGGGYGGAGIGGGFYGRGSIITINGGCIKATGSYDGENIGSGEEGDTASGVVLKGGCYTNKPDSKYIQSGYFIDDNTDTATKDSYPYAISQKTDCVYLDENGESQSCADYTVINKYNMPITWTAGWYVVQGTADYTKGGTITNGITCSGAVHLILTDGCALTVKGADGKAGICVTGSNSLTIYGQTNGSGSLKATGGNDCAGIGGFKDHNGEMGDGRNITINGGTVTATGGEFSAGIGGGMNLSGSNITITGGTVTATGGVRGAGIGGGTDSNGSNITITGGTVKAIGGSDGNLGAAGIGGGKRGYGSNIIINGGCINATGKDGGENIGSGSGGTASGVVLKGGRYTNKPDSKYIPDGYFAGNNTDTATKADYPYIIHQTAGCLVLDGDYPGTFSADGEEVEAGSINGHNYIRVPDGAKVLTYYEFNAGSDAHGTYPVSMKVWLLSQDAGSGEWTATELTELENLLSYCGTSIRTTGKKGVRLVTGINGSLKKQLIAGLNGYTLSEYGTVMAWTDKLSGEGLTLNDPNGVSNFAYSRANNKDPVFRTVKGLVQYTNVLVFDSLPDTSLARDITMRPYLKLVDAQGNELVIYGGELVRSVGYVAYQNRNAFKPGTREYEYIWKIILAAYGEQYLDEYVSK